MSDLPELPTELRRMLRTGRLDRVEPNPVHAATLMTMAEQHLATARALSGTEDVAMAFTAAYDGARKALTAVLAVHGLRVRPVGGAHRNTGVAASELVEDPALGEFDWMRQVRNATEYPDADRPTASRQDLEEALEAAADIVSACRRVL